jgi:hypothetical protein
MTAKPSLAPADARKISGSGFRLFALEATADFGNAIARLLGHPLSPHEERGFEDGELKRALARLKGVKAIEIVPGATHLFSEPGAMDAVTDHAARWFERHLRAAPSSGRIRSAASR